jgi:hypothetical protein
MPFRKSFAAGISQSVFALLPRSEGGELEKITGLSLIASTELALVTARLRTS